MLSNFVEWDVFGVVLVLFVEEFCDTVKNIIGIGGDCVEHLCEFHRDQGMQLGNINFVRYDRNEHFRAKMRP